MEDLQQLKRRLSKIQNQIKTTTIKMNIGNATSRKASADGSKRKDSKGKVSSSNFKVEEINQGCKTQRLRPSLQIQSKLKDMNKMTEKSSKPFETRKNSIEANNLRQISNFSKLLKPSVRAALQSARSKIKTSSSNPSSRVNSSNSRHRASSTGSGTQKLKIKNLSQKSQLLLKARGG